MMPRRHTGRWSWSGRPAKAVLLLGLFLSVLGVANSATLHQLIHSDAASANHHCAATLLASGQVDAPASAVQVVPAAPISVSLIFPDISAPAEISFNLPLGRGPPAPLS